VRSAPAAWITSSSPTSTLDATYLHVRNNGAQVTSMAVVIATAITAVGHREVLGVDVGDSEINVFWRGFLRSLKSRGLSGVRLVASDQHAGLIAAQRRILQGASHQRCRVHFARNLLALVPKSHQDMVAAVFRTIFAQPDPATVSTTWDQVRDQLADRFPKIGPLMDGAKAEMLAFSAFPRTHWTKVWSTNPSSSSHPATDIENQLEDHHSAGRSRQRLSLWLPAGLRRGDRSAIQHPVLTCGQRTQHSASAEQGRSGDRALTAP
jgi:transposase-like protein